MKYIFLLLLIISSLLSKDESVTKHIFFYEQQDISHDINIIEKTFDYLESSHSNFGFTNSIFWLTVDINNTEDKTSEQVLYFPYTLLDYIDIFEEKNHELLQERSYGDLRVYKNDGYLPDPSLFIQLAPYENKTFYFKIQTQGSMNIDLIVLDKEAYISKSIEKAVALSFYFGAVIIMILYNFILFLFIRDRSYFIYIIFHLNYLFFSLTFNGFSSAYFWPNSPYLNNYMVPFLMSVGSILALVFSMDFLQFKEQSLKIYKMLQTLLVINILATVLVFVLSYYYASLLTSVISLISIFAILLSSGYSHFISKNANAKFFALAWGILLAGIFTIHLRNLGVLPVNLLTSYAFIIGAFLELTLLSIVLAYRYNIQREEIAMKSQALIRQSRLAGMGEMINHIAHQWRQPLNRVNLSLAVINKIIKSEYLDKNLLELKIQSSEENLQYMSETIEDFSNFFAPNKKLEYFKLEDIIYKAETLLENRLKDIKLIKVENFDFKLYGYENEYLQVLLVILNNAIDNFEIQNTQNKQIEISSYEDKHYHYLRISDNGGGVKDEYIDKLFDPYFTTKFKGEGTGLGLYMAKMIIENSMHGELRVRSYEDKAIFTIKMIRRGI